VSFSAADRLARALLYEGYALYPYRRSSLKNQQRWTFGGLFPGGGVGEPSIARCQCLLRGEPKVELRLRFLQLFGDQAMEREITATGEFELPAVDGGRALKGRLTVEARPFDSAALRSGGLRGQQVHVLTIEVENLGTHGDDASLKSFASPHVLIHAPHGELVSMTDPPEDLAEVAGRCRSEVLWPVLLSKQLLICSPIILEDFPRIAPESPIDLFDSGEIDEILTLRIMTLTDAEKCEARRDPRTAALIDRVEALSDAERAQLHGTLRAEYGRGDRVRLRPTARADVMDLALTGRLATVADIERFVDGSVHCVVTVDDDPAAHRFFFRPEELERA
jgi:hypothetical protein